MSSHNSSKQTLITAATIFLLLSLFKAQTHATKSHVITFRSPNLYPESLTWDPSSQHFIVGSLFNQTIFSVSDAGVLEPLLSDPSLPPSSAVLGLSLDLPRRRLLAVLHSPTFNALASYHLPSLGRLFLTPLEDESTQVSANDVAIDFDGNAYVTNSAGDFIWKVNVDGQPSVLSRSKVFKSHTVDHTMFNNSCGLNGVVYISKGYLLVVQSNTGKLYKVNVEDGTARNVILNKELTAGNGIAARRDGVVVVVSQHKVYFIKSDDSWSEGVVFDETALEVEREASGVVVGEEDRVYVLYGHVNEGIMGNLGREEFGIVEVRSEKESKEENVWVYVLIGLGLVYFLFWRFQMRQLVSSMDKKRA